MTLHLDNKEKAERIRAQGCDYPITIVLLRA
jgi:hypothetical protein